MNRLNYFPGHHALNLWMLLITALLFCAGIVHAGEPDTEQVPVDYLTFAQGAVPIALEGDSKALRVGFEQAIQSIDGDLRPFSLLLKPGGKDTAVEFIYALPAKTTFTRFAVTNVWETPSPSQTFIKMVEVFGSNTDAETGYTLLASGELLTHKQRNETTEIPVQSQTPVRWVKLRLSGGINILTEKSFLEFSEIIGNGSQEPVTLIDRFNGEWKGKGVLVKLQQKSATVTGCYDRRGDLTGTVTGNILRATGVNRDDKTQSVFVLTVTPDHVMRGVRSSNGAPFRLYTGLPAPNGTVTACSKSEVPKLGCGSIIHGINFDYDSATIRPDSEPVLADLYAGLKSSADSSIVIEGHTSSEGSEPYNQALSERRAQAVVDALIRSGLAADRISATGKGEAVPIAKNTDETGRSLNRRVEVKCAG